MSIACELDRRVDKARTLHLATHKETLMTTDTFGTHLVRRDAKPISRYLTIGARVLLGLVFFVFGLNHFLSFMPPPKTMPEGAAALAGAFAKSGYLFQLIGGTQVIAGAMLLTNRFVPLALAFLAPVIVNIILFHAFLEPSGLLVPVVVLALELFLAWAYRETFLPMLAMRVAPSAQLHTR
jgi:uncharacterized membrane protein YphA (DoxX/SURF4 family)